MGGLSSDDVPLWEKEPVRQAREIAEEAHEGQEREGTGEPYVNHPIRVTEYCWKHFALGVSDEGLAAAVLHDVLEDCGAKWAGRILRGCGSQVLGLTDLLTKPEAEDFRSKRYMARMLVVPAEALLIKVADRIDNLQDLGAAGWSAERWEAYLQGTRPLWEALSARGQRRARVLLVEALHTSARELASAQGKVG